tara:strand:- start:341 stop:508 length:168 start_codon:yes stop_codon:yes gene_type:complete
VHRVIGLVTVEAVGQTLVNNPADFAPDLIDLIILILTLILTSKTPSQEVSDDDTN